MFTSTRSFFPSWLNFKPLKIINIPPRFAALNGKCVKPRMGLHPIKRVLHKSHKGRWAWRVLTTLFRTVFSAQEIKTCLKWDKSSHLIVVIMRSLNVKITSSGTRIFTPRPKGTWRLSHRLRGTSPGKEKEMSVYNLTQASLTFYAVRPTVT